MKWKANDGSFDGNLMAVFVGFVRDGNKSFIIKGRGSSVVEQPIRNMLLDVEAIGLPSIINGLATHHCTSFPLIVGRSRQNQSKKSGADGPNERTKPATLTSSSNVGHHHLTPEQLGD